MSEPSLREQIRLASAKATGLIAKRNRIEKRVAGQAADSPDRQELRRVKAELTETDRALNGLLLGFGKAVDDGIESRRQQAEIERLSQPSSIERLLPGSKHAIAARERRMRYLAQAKGNVAATSETNVEPIAKDDKADLVESLELAVSDALNMLEGDSNQVGALIERLRVVLDRVETLSESAKTISPVAPKSVLANSLSNEIGRALGLAGKIRTLRSGR